MVKLIIKKVIFSESSAFVVHLDMDCFFVSIGLKSRPDLIGKPIVITNAKVCLWYFLKKLISPLPIRDGPKLRLVVMKLESLV